MRCPEHTYQTSIFEYISRAKTSRNRHANSRCVAHSGAQARLGSNHQVFVGFSTELCDPIRCPGHTYQTSIFDYISRSVFSRNFHAKTRSVAHATSLARLRGRLSCACSARWRSVRERDSTVVRRILTAQHDIGEARQVSVVKPASEVCVAGSSLLPSSPSHAVGAKIR